MANVTAAIQRSGVVVEIGGVPIRLRCDNGAFLDQMEERYAGYVSPSSGARFIFDIQLASPDTESGDLEVQVSGSQGAG